MKFRPLGKSGLEVPVITFGAWAIGGWYWGGTDDERAIQALHRAFDLGIRFIDTAPMYGMGHSETIVGEAVKGMKDRPLIATKCGLRWDVEKGGKYFFTTEDGQGNEVRVRRILTAESIIEECEASLLRLGVETIDLYQCHFPDTTAPAEETMSALLSLKEQGKIQAIGVSNFSPAQMDEFLAFGPLACNQPKYSLLAREMEKDVLPFCRENGLGILAYSPLGQGLLTGKVTLERTFEKGDVRASLPWFQPRNRRRILEALKRIQSIAKVHRASVAQLAISWVISQPGVTSAIVGARSPVQVEENAGAAELHLTEEDLNRVGKAFEDLGDPLPK